MPNPNPNSTAAVLAWAGVGGALAGVLIGALALRRAPAPAHEEISETVDDLKRRAETILAELSRTEPPVGSAEAPSSLN